MARAVVLTIDGLGSKYLGPYGNTWIETRAFNQLAADSLLLDGVYAPHSDVAMTLDALWKEQSAPLSHPHRLQQIGVHTAVMSDVPEVLDSPLAADFAEHIEVTHATGLNLAAEWDETHTAQFFAQAIDCVNRLDNNAMLWIHSGGLSNPWDAPYEFRAQYAEEDDPDPSGSAQVPSLKLESGYDPDALHEIQCALAGQVALLDQCFGVLLTVLQTDAADVFFAMTSPRGFPLGEHSRVGLDAPSLSHELLWVPGLIRYPHRRWALRRVGGLNTVSDISQAMMDWVSHGNKPTCIETECASQREYSVSRGQRDVLLRTPVWQIRFRDLGSETEFAELYLKPDDQNEVNNVASRCPQVVEAGKGFLKMHFETNPAESEKLSLPDVLREPLE